MAPILTIKVQAMAWTFIYVGRLSDCLRGDLPECLLQFPTFRHN
ncbi:hypothetical protein QWZ16_06370 [Vibrio ostreicida]|uniref:Uncharacterized protein n=1 Tax=Vibrio ostreicida TaxID=526588 RepID=A0ABT8BQF6_9VIBR|nr:hypothetical protein [Vibrio ostreicida]MDN3609345.1 hypothetical protein [Vibrio ostreicida]